MTPPILPDAGGEPRASVPVASVIIPAHNEAAVIGQTLRPLADAAARGDLEVIVVCNACTDDTEAAAAAFPGIRVLESEIPSKSQALNLGDDAASTWPRIYLDADIVADPASLLATAAVLRGDHVFAARPAAEFDLRGTTALVKSYYRARSRIPSLRSAMWGAGVYALSEEGHARIGRFPDLKGDDLLVDRTFTPSEKTVVDVAPVRVRVPRTLRALLAITRRNISGAREPGPAGGGEHAPGGILRELLRSVRSPRGAFDAAVYCGVALTARATLRRGDLRWERDDTSRG